jgi:hypothetical protein
MFDMCCSSRPLGFDFVNGKVTIAGEGNAAVSWTTRADIAAWLVNVLIQQPREKLLWSTFRIEGDRCVSIFEADEFKRF